MYGLMIGFPLMPHAHWTEKILAESRYGLGLPIGFPLMPRGGWNGKILCRGSDS